MSTLVQKPRALVLCFDGTNDEYSAQNTNIIKFFSLLKKDDFTQQLCYYQAGIGTFFAPGVVSPIFQWCAKILDEAVAWYLNAHVMDGYRFLMQNYRVGDKICLFGFSRGAYTARALAGMLYKVGLLPKDNQEQINFAFKMYKSGSDEDSAGFKQTFCQNVKIDFVGVWDTVASVGVIMGKTLPFSSSNSSIKTFRHALSLDEHRARFRPSFYVRSSPETKTASAKKTARFPNGLFQGPAKQRPVIHAPATEEETDVLEVWFSGCHSDVGGGETLNTADYSLSDITLRWMVREVIDSKCGILFNDSALVQMSLPLVTTPYEDDPSNSNSPYNLDKIDATQTLHDELRLQPLWWILEILFLQYTYQDAQGNWHTSYWPHLGKGRDIYDANPKFHVTVKERMNDKSLAYKPKALYTAGTEVYVH